jgi:hypothetical protein
VANVEQHVASPGADLYVSVMEVTCIENVAQFRYLGTTITNENLIQEEN